MSVDEEKKFVMKHTFTDILSLTEDEEVVSQTEEHFNIPWTMILQKQEDVEILLDHQQYLHLKNYGIKIEVKMTLEKPSGEKLIFEESANLSKNHSFCHVASISNRHLKPFLLDGKLTVECHVWIIEMDGIKNFEVSEKFNESNKKYSDVVLKVNDQKFYVLKQFLAYHSTYFKSLFFGNFEESGKMEVELENVEPYVVQHFLELIYGYTLVDDDTVDGILKLADMYDSKTAIRRCEEFLRNNLKQQDNLMEKCFSDIKTPQDIRSILPEDKKTSMYIWSKKKLTAVQQKLSASSEEKNFVMNHVFTDVCSSKFGSFKSNKEKHFDVGWVICLFNKSDGYFKLCLECPKIEGNDAYSIKAEIELQLHKRNGEDNKISKLAEFSPENKSEFLCTFLCLEEYLFGSRLNVGLNVKILKMTGIKENLRNFDHKELSDVVLIVKNKKFHVLKHYLAVHSTYFKSLFFGNFDESKQSEVELKDIDPKEFQNYLELIYGESVVYDCTVSGMLKLADFFDSKTAIRRCEEFLLKSSQKTLKQKFELANNYKLEMLMENCLSEIKTEADARSIIPSDPKELSPDLWKKLFEKLLIHWK